MSNALNDRRHGPDLHIPDKDLLTGRDARRLIAQEFARRDAKEASLRADALTIEQARNAEWNALPWWNRAFRVVRRCVQLRTPPK